MPTPSDVIPDVSSLDPDDHVLAALAERFPQCRIDIVSSGRLRTAVGVVRTTTGASPEAIVDMLSSRELDSAQRPVGVLVSRCAKIVGESGVDGEGVASSLVVASRASEVTSTTSALVTHGTVTHGTVTHGTVSVLPPSPWAATDRRGLGSGGPPLFTPSTRLHERKAEPAGGWRRSMLRLTGGLVNLGPGAAERRRSDLVERVKRPVAGYRSIAVMSMTGGVGKTTLAAMVGHTFARYRGDRVVAIDASPHPGTLAHRIPGAADVSVRDLLAREQLIQRYADVRHYAAQASSRLEVVASDSDPTISSPFDAGEYERASELLSRFYTVLLTDCGPGMLYPAMAAVLTLADQLVLVTSPSVDGARAGGQLLDWLDAHGCSDLVRDAVVVINAVRRRTAVDLEECARYFARRTREVRRVPYDDVLAVGTTTALESVAEVTQHAYLDLSATIADGFTDTVRLPPTI